MDPLVGNIIMDVDLDLLNSNSIGSLINLCSLCNLQFTDNLNVQDDTSRVEKILDIFLSDDSEHGQVQLCSNCKLICANLICAKQSLLMLIDKITNLILQNSRFTLVNPKYKIIPKLFQFRFNSRNTPKNTSTSTCSAETSESMPMPMPSITAPGQSNSVQVTSVANLDNDNFPNGFVRISTNNSLISNQQQAQPFPVGSQSQHQQLEGQTVTGNIINPPKSITSDKAVQSHAQLIELDNVINETNGHVLHGVQILEPDNSLQVVHPTLSNQIIHQEIDLPHADPISSTDTDQCLRIQPNNETIETIKKKYECELCRKSYRQKKALNIHILLHKGEAKYQCSVCFKIFTQKSGLKRHLPIHTGERAFKCPLCEKSFRFHTSYKIHTLSHEGKKQFACNICELTFLSSSHLRRHERSHSGAKPYSCTICPKTFSEKYNLETHIRTHTGESAYKCQHCSAGFNRKHQLNLHLETAHSSKHVP